MLVCGFGIFGYVTSTVEEKFQETGVAMDGILLESGQKHSVSVSLYSEDELFLLVSSIPRGVPLIAQVSDMNGDVIYEAAFDSEHIEPIPHVREGDYVISITNVGDKQVVINALVSAEPITDQLDIIMNITIVMIVGILLILAGIIILIVGAILLFVNRRKISHSSE